MFASGLRREERGIEEGVVEVIEAVEVMDDVVEMVGVVEAVDVVEFKEAGRENAELFAKRPGEKVLFVLAIGIALLFADAEDDESKEDEEENANERGVRINENIMRKMKKDFAVNISLHLKCFSNDLELLVDMFSFLSIIFSVVLALLILIAFISSSLTIKFDIQHCLYFYI